MRPCVATLLLTNRTVLLAGMPTHAQIGHCALSGPFPSPPPSSGLDANAPGECVEAPGGLDAGQRGQSQSRPGIVSSQTEGCVSCLRDPCSPSSELSTLTGHRGHCLLTQPGQEPCHLQKRVHTFGYFHVSVSNFLKNKPSLNLVSKYWRNLCF